MKVREIMTANPACCTPDSTLQEVAQMMKQNDCGLIPVVDSKSSLRPIGTITDRDITIRTVAAGHDPVGMRASDVMTTHIATVTPETSIEQCFDVMEDREIRRVLVTDQQGKCVGIVAQADVVQSDANPARTNRVIREISESSPSRNQPVHFSGSSSSFMSSSSLLPLLLGFGSGMAISYMMNNRDRSSHRIQSSHRYTPAFQHENRMDLTNREGFDNYANADRRIENQPENLGNATRTPQPGISSTRTDAFRDDTPNTKGRSAGQGR
jgi:CBS domain-containing protein